MLKLNKNKMRWISLRLSFFIILASINALVVKPCLALEPPRPGEIDELKRRNIYNKQLDNAKRLGNHKIDTFLLKKAINKG